MHAHVQQIGTCSTSACRALRLHADACTTVGAAVNAGMAVGECAVAGEAELAGCA